MSTDKTLADVRPGGRVRLGNGPTIEKRARELLAAEHRKCDRNTEADLVLAGDVTALGQIALNAIIAALSAQPSPGGQGDAQTIEKLRAMMDHSFGGPGFVVYGTAQSIAEVERRLAPDLAARQPVGEPVAFMVRWKPEGGFGLEWPKNMQYFRDRADEYEIVPLQRGDVPAQAVDLGQFRASVLHAYEEIHDGYHSEKLGSLLALIDSHSAGGQP